ncbi:MAG: peptide-methionine (S)-S-oxide reductase MsrA [Bacteroidetes bacterium]|nr:peptide-methionine (S)-S-oxide reductase MsrA [Bacteroidota bacterium]
MTVVKSSIWLYCFLLYFSFQSCAQKNKRVEKIVDKDLSKYKTAYFASGCFWCVEAIYETVDGVIEAESGYAGGKIKNPSYEEVCQGNTGHAETIKVYYDSTKVSYQQLVRIFFNSHDPTTRNKQGPDSGTQYRSAIFYQNPTEKKIAQNYIDSLLTGKHFKAITTELSLFTSFYKAENYHQDFKLCNPDHPYIQNVSNPRLKEFQRKEKFNLKN